ncbi:site-specific DNA-methyltransferase [Bradyrhizobium sp. AZCC 1699]|uniref:site-specific DNA-methyltransferase n=1 Tax=Bradyrhizobium sp. AZCC 1699 TaxID=3117024 RepID=UPI002FF31FD1
MKRPAVQDTTDELEGEEEFELEAQEEPTATEQPTKKGKAKKGNKRKAPGELAQIVSYRYPDKRVNNPEVGMVHPENDPDQPETVWRYDPHIDPALQFDSARSRVEALIDDALASDDSARMREALAELKRLQAPYLNWTGKAERTSFEVDTVSLHVHERIDPASILAAVRRRLKGEKGGQERALQPGLFDAPFESLPLRQAVDFYKHEKNWSNRLIAGDSLLVMNSLLKKESMAGQVQMIYVDPPYGIKYGSNFQPFTNKRDVKDGADADLTQEPEMIKAFRDTWELGIHSYLTYLRDRLLLAKELLHESGSIFVQISEENLHHVREVLDEVFGNGSFVALITYSTTGGFSSATISRTGDYVLWYARKKEKLKFHQLFTAKDIYDAARDDYDQLELASGERRPLTKEEKRDPHILPDDGRLFTDGDPTSQGEGAATTDHEYCGMTFHPGEGNHWKAPVPHGMRRLSLAKRFQITPKGKLRYIRYLRDFDQKPVTNAWFDIAGAVQDRADPKVYVVQTSNKVIERCILMTTDPGDLVLDPTCGSGTSAFVAEKWGRRWITCDTSRVAVTLAKQRLMTASFKYYALRYPQEGLHGGFIYQVVPHVTLGSIANNPDIDEIYTDSAAALSKALGELNAALAGSELVVSYGSRKGRTITIGQKAFVQEWEVPYAWPESWPHEARASFDAFHALRNSIQRKIDRSIAAHAESDTLYDQPAIDDEKLRITGPFSVEAVPSPTVLGLDDAPAVPTSDSSVARSGETSRQSTLRDELLKAGIRGKSGQTLKFAELEPIPGLRNLHASGTLADTGERVVVSFGPEHAALEQRQVELALKDAEKLRPSPKLVLFCAFTFDPEAAKDIDEINWPGVTMLRVQMNADLLTQDLKKARSSNESFWLMGQPDVELRALADGRWQVEVNGFDYFDTKKGELVSGGKNKIAMWSLDPDYDQRSLFPHQVFFPIAGKKDGWRRLKNALRAELDQDLLEQFHGTVSLPFEAGKNQCIAVKIVDDRGIESLKVIPLNR